MDFEVKKRDSKNTSLYRKEDFKLAMDFAKAMYKEFGPFIRALVLFGSSISKPASRADDVDVLVIIDDVRFKLSRPLVETYRIITAKAISDISPQRLHIQSMRFTSFWEFVRAGDPVAINILRYGVSLIDTGFFDPLQALLDQGRIRPSPESVWTYFTLAPASLERSRDKVLSATIDLYWAVIDSAHAVLMHHHLMPPSPDHVADMLERTLIPSGHIKKKYAEIMREFYSVYKGIVHRDIKYITGTQYDRYRGLCQEFVDGMKEYIERK